MKIDTNRLIYMEIDAIIWEYMEIDGNSLK